MNNTWQEETVDDIVVRYLDFRGKTPLKLGMDWGGGEIKALSANNVEMGKVNFNKECYLASEELYNKWMNKGDCKKGDILLTMEAPLGNVAQIPDNKKYILSQRTILLKTKDDKVDKNFLQYLFSGNEFQRSLYINSTGSTVIGIQQKKLAKVDIKYPQDIKTQQIITKILSAVDAVIKKTEQTIAKHKVIKKGMMHDLFSRGIDLKTGKIRPSFEEAPELYKKSELGMIPKEWSTDILDNLTNQIIDGTHHTPTYTENGVPFLRVTDVQSKEINFDKIKFVSEKEHKILSKRCNPEKGDILYSKNGTIGIPKIVDWDWDFSVFVSLALIKPKKKVNTRFLISLLEEEIIWKQIRKRAKQGTVTNLHLEEIREFVIPIPQPKEQKEIAKRIVSIQNLIDLEKENLKKHQKLKRGLMQDLLTGKVEVKV